MRHVSQSKRQSPCVHLVFTRSSSSTELGISPSPFAERYSMHLGCLNDKYEKKLALGILMLTNCGVVGPSDLANDYVDSEPAPKLQRAWINAQHIKSSKVFNSRQVVVFAPTGLKALCVQSLFSIAPSRGRLPAAYCRLKAAHVKA